MSQFLLFSLSEKESCLILTHSFVFLCRQRERRYCTKLQRDGLRNRGGTTQGRWETVASHRQKNPSNFFFLCVKSSPSPPLPTTFFFFSIHRTSAVESNNRVSFDYRKKSKESLLVNRWSASKMSCASARGGSNKTTCDELSIASGTVGRVVVQPFQSYTLLGVLHSTLQQHNQLIFDS